MSKSIKRLLALVLLGTVIISGTPVKSEAKRINPKHGFMSDAKEIRISDKEFSKLLSDSGSNRISRIFTSGESYWAKFESRYYYNKMNATQKTVYDKMYSLSMSYLTGSANIPDGGMKKNLKDYYMVFETEGLSRDDISFLVYAFLNSNPQFFFLNGSGIELYYSSYTNIKGFAFNLYPEYKSGSYRLNAASKAKAKLDTWMATLSGKCTEYDKAKAIYDLVAGALTYDNDAYYSGDTEKIGRHQSAATALFTGVSVCAGYAEIYGMLAAASGLECITVTSYDHEWNQVKIGDNWYCVDVTWDDSGSYAGNYYFLKNDNFFRSTGHVPEGYYRAYRPECFFDWTPSRGTGENSCEKTEYNITYVNGYTNESNPTKYKKGDEIKLTNPTRKGYKFVGWYDNSELSGSKIKQISKDESGDKKLYARWKAITYNVKFYKNGGKGSMRIMENRKYDKTYNLYTNKYKRSGYKFIGWAKTRDGKVVYKNKASIKNLTSTDGKTVKLYARWAKS